MKLYKNLQELREDAQAGNEAMLSAVSSFREAISNEIVREQIEDNFMADLHFKYRPIEDLEKYEKFTQALLVVQEFLKPNSLILLRFLINRAYFVGYNQGYEDAE